MCLIVFAYKLHPKHPFILLANRDEFYNRPTESVHYWADAPDIYAGKDLVGGGTWLGITRGGRFAAVTNYREVGAERGTFSRGNLVSDFLKSSASVDDYLENVKSDSTKFSGFNLLVGTFSKETSELGYFSNREGEIKILDAGIYGLSNHLLDTPWQKVSKAKSDLSEILASNREIQTEQFFTLLQNKTPAPEKDLPNTGVGVEYEKILSPIFIETHVYGTRCSSVVLFENTNGLTLNERIFH